MTNAELLSAGIMGYLFLILILLWSISDKLSDINKNIDSLSVEVSSHEYD